MAADAESAKMPKATTVVALLSAKRLKLANMIASQKISTTRKGMGIADPASAKRSSRVFPSSCSGTYCSSLERALCFVLRRPVSVFHRIVIRHAALASNGAPSPEGEQFSRQIRSAIEVTTRRIQIAGQICFRPILRQRSVQQNDVGG